MAKNPPLEISLNEFTKVVFGTKRDGTQCVTCKTHKVLPCDFRDAVSYREFKISFMCQKCQDQVFGIEE